MVGDKTTVERGLMKRELIGYSKISLNLVSVHCSRSSNKHEEQQKQQNNSIHIKSSKNSRTSRLRENQFGYFMLQGMKSGMIERFSTCTAKQNNVNHFSK